MENLDPTRKTALNLDPDTFRRAGYQLIDSLAGLLESLPDRQVTTGATPRSIRTVLGDESLPAQGQPLEEVLQKATQLLFDHSLFNGHPRFWGYITSSPAPAGMLADLLAAAVNANVGAFTLSPMATEIEKQTIRWIAEFIGYPVDCGGLFVSGGNMANITCLMAARKAKATWDVRTEGLRENRLLVYCSRGTHTWIQKAMDVMGIGLVGIRWIDMTTSQLMDTTKLEDQIRADIADGFQPMAVIGNAGTVGAGAVDPLDILAAICKKYTIWFHVDGAYGAPAAVLPEAAALFKGMELADSVALDPHKWLYAPLEAGCVLVRNIRHLQEAFSFHPDYYNFTGQAGDPVTNFLEEGFQNSRGFRALKVWVMLQQAGKANYERMIREDIKLAHTLYSMAAAHDELQAVTHHLSITTFRYVPRAAENFPPHYINTLNEKILNAIQASGEAYVSNAVINGQYCLRACVVNFRTSAHDMDALVKLVVREGRRLHRESVLKTTLL